MFTQFRVGRTAAVETVLLVLTGLIGIGITAAVLTMRLRFSLGRDDHPERTASGALGYLGVSIAIVAGVITLVSMALWWIGMLSPAAILAVGAHNVVEAVVTNWLPTFAGTLIQVVIAVLAGFGVGWLRPLGRGSRWLLLLFSPWLLVAATTLAPARFLATRAAGRLETWTSLLPHSWVAVPLLFVCVLVFDALRDRFDHPGPRDRSAAVAGAGVIALATGITLVTQGLSLGRMLTGPTHHTNAAMLFSLYSAQSMRGWALPQQALMPLPLLMLLLGVSLAIQLLCAPYVRLTAGQAQTWPSRTSSAASRSSS